MSMKLGIIGAGKMAGALVKGWVNTGIVQASQVGINKLGTGTPSKYISTVISSLQVLASVPEKDSFLLDPLRELGCGTTHNNLDAVHHSDVILLGVKPNVVPHVAKELHNKGKGQLLISVAAGNHPHGLFSSL